ncbi:MAG: hypothetical protein QM775_28375 [Pirellulales bacterium]
MITKSQLSVPRQKLLELMQKLNFGRFQQLRLEQGEPVLNPPPLVVQDLKMGGNNDPRVEIHLRNFTLKQAHVELFHHFDAIQDGVIDEMEVRAGLPQMVKIKRPLI